MKRNLINLYNLLKLVIIYICIQTINKRYILQIIKKIGHKHVFMNLTKIFNFNIKHLYNKNKNKKRIEKLINKIVRNYI